MPEAAKLTPEEEKAIAAIRGAGKGPPAGGKEDAGALGSGLLGALDAATLGLAPALDDYLREKGIIDVKTAPPSMREQLAAGAELHPYASFAGRAGGTILPFAGVAKAAQAGLGAGKLAAGAIGAGGANVADQLVRTQTEGREFSPGEAAISTAVGGLGPAALGGIHGLAKNAAQGAARRLIPGIAERVIGPAESAVASELPGVAGEAARASRSVLDDAAAAFKAAKKPPAPTDLPNPLKPGSTPFAPGPRAPAPKAPVDLPNPLTPKPAPGPLTRPGPPPLEDLATYAPDDPLAEIAKLARSTRPPPEPGPIPPPRTPDLGPPMFDPAKPLEGIRPSKLQPGSPLYEQLAEKIRAAGEGRPPTPLPEPAPAAPPPTPSPPGLLDGIPLGKLSAAAGLTAGEQTRKNRVEEQKRRRKKRY